MNNHCRKRHKSTYNQAKHGQNHRNRSDKYFCCIMAL